jgi:hypothetical protein
MTTEVAHAHRSRHHARQRAVATILRQPGRPACGGDAVLPLYSPPASLPDPGLEVTDLMSARSTAA